MWLYRLVDQGHSVVGVEIYSGAVSGIFSDAGLSPKVTTSANNNVTIYEVECVSIRSVHSCLTRLVRED